jgi:hypothetical protein
MPGGVGGTVSDGRSYPDILNICFSALSITVFFIDQRLVCPIYHTSLNDDFRRLLISINNGSDNLQPSIFDGFSGRLPVQAI